jgi:hypothetical protein
MIAARGTRSLDRMSFTRGPWVYNAAERRMLQLEIDLRTAIAQTEPWDSLRKPLQQARKVLTASQNAQLETKQYAGHDAGLATAIRRLARAREAAWDQRADDWRQAAVNVERDPNAVNNAAEEARLTAVVNTLLTGVRPEDRARRVADLRARAAGFDRFGDHVRALTYAALVPSDPARAALVAGHAGTTNLIAGPAVEQAGGSAQVPKLDRLLGITGGSWARLATLLAAAAGNAAAFDRLYDQIVTFHGSRAAVATTPALPPRRQPPTVVNGRVGYNAAHMGHFLQRHTYDWFNFAAINALQGFWPAGTTPDEITGYLEEALVILHPPIWFGALRAALPPRPPMVPIPAFAIPSGFNVTVGIGWGPGGVRVVGQFFPMADGARVIDLSLADLTIIRTVLGV